MLSVVLDGGEARCVGRHVVGGAIKTVSQSARRGMVVVRRRSDRSHGRQGHRRGADGDTVLAVVDSPPVGKDVDIGAFRAEFAVPLTNRDLVSGGYGKGHAERDTGSAG